MSQTHSYAVLRLTIVVSDTLKEQGWVLVDTLESDSGSYAAMREWFDANKDPEVGKYWLVEFTSYGGNFIEFEVKQTLVLEEVKRLTEVA